MGSVQLKDTVYLLPFSEEHLESLQWLASEVVSMGGEGAFLRTDRIEPMSDETLFELFNEARAKDYQAIEKEFSVLERKLDSIKKGGRKHGVKALSAQYAKLIGNYEEVLRIDYFSSPYGESLREKSSRIKRQLSLVESDKSENPSASIIKRKIGDYRGRVWATRKRPFIDRMATAWLVRKFIDPDAGFEFVEDGENAKADCVLFDIQGGEFTHVGDLCTFEVIIKSFALKDKAVHKIAETVHELDIKDGKYSVPEARGIEDILSGIRKAPYDDIEALDKGMDVFEMFYLSLK